jgi:hypothetical protein
MSEITQTTPDDAIAAALPKVNPKALLEAIDDPTVFPEIARGDFYIWMCNMRQRAQNPSTPMPALLEYGKLLAKIGKLDVQETTQPGSGFSITINIPKVGDSPASSMTLEAAPPRVVSDETVDGDG